MQQIFWKDSWKFPENFLQLILSKDLSLN